jgi:hypothetical protein
VWLEYPSGGQLWATSHLRKRARDHCILSTLIVGKGGVQHHALEGPMEQGIMQDGCKIYTGSYMVSNGSCFMVTWSVFKNHYWR